jgi:hypothetical protein
LIRIGRIHIRLLLFLPDNLFTGYEPIAFIAEKSLTAFGTDDDFFAAVGAVSLHVEFIVNGIAVTVLTKKTWLLPK